MFRNYFITAVRNFARHRLYSFINILGLAAGLACAIFIVLYLRDEISYDKWIPGSDNLYRAEISLYFPASAPIIAATSPFMLGPTMKAELPEVEGETHITRQNSTISVGDRKFPERINVVDSNFFSIIQLPLVEGRAENVFAQPGSVVLSRSTARKYFGDKEAVGKRLTVDAAYQFTVTGVMRDLPHNTQLDGRIFIPNTSNADQLSKNVKSDWFTFVGWTYIRLSPKANIRRVQDKTRGILARHIPPDVLSAMHVRANRIAQASLVPFRDVHLTSDNAKDGMRPGGNWTAIYGLAVIAALILGIACFNFTNLATARALVRAREVSLRKVAGARRRQLIIQLLGESVATALIAMIFALAIVEILTPVFDRFLDRPIEFHYLSDWALLLGVVAIAVTAGFLGGFYPALVLSRFRPAAMLRPSATGQTGSGIIRTVLIVLQFGISISLAVTALVIFAQIRYAREVDLGLEHDHIVIVANNGDQRLSPAATENFLHALNSHSGIIAGAAQSSAVPFEGNEGLTNASAPGTPRLLTVRAIDMSPEFFNVYEMKLLAGRFLTRTHGSDISTTTGSQNIIGNGTNVVIDAMAARTFGFAPADAVGRAIKIDGQNATIAGVIQDALFRGVRFGPIASVYYFNPGRLTDVSVRVRAGYIRDGLQIIDRTWNRFAPSIAIRRHFLNDSFDKSLAVDKQQGTLFGGFVGITILIACLGLFGLAAFAAERRTKEIGVRKAFGASTRDVVRLLLWQFSIPVLIANIIAWPAAWYYLHNWLGGYAHRIALSPIYFLAAGILALAIAWATVLAHTVRVASASPIRALRYE